MATDPKGLGLRASGCGLGVLGLALLLASSTAYAHPESPDSNAPRSLATDSADDKIPTPPPVYKGNNVTVDEHLGAKLPLDTAFTTSDGKAVTLGQLIAGDIPTILTFNYSDCPMLCSLQLNGLSTALPTLLQPTPALRVGAQLKIVTIDLEPTEPLAKLARMKAKYVEHLPPPLRAGANTGWTFLKGDAASIRRVADAVGFKYTYIPERAEWAHPAALIFIATSGIVTRYVYGIEFDSPMLRDSIMKAGQAEPATAVGFMNRCYHYDPDANNHSRAGVLALRIGAAGFVVLLVAGLGLWNFLRKQRS